MWILEPLLITKAERQRLEHVVRAHKSPQRIVRRARVVLLAAEGWPNRRIATEVGLWRRRVDKGRMASLEDMPPSGRPRLYGHDEPLKIVAAVTSARPEGGAQGAQPL